MPVRIRSKPNRKKHQINTLGNTSLIGEHEVGVEIHFGQVSLRPPRH